MNDTTASHMPTLAELSSQLMEMAERKELEIVTVESCTGGQLAATLTNVEGLSHIFNRALVTYNDNAKTDLVHVPEKLIAEQGAVSEPVAQAMACGGRMSIGSPCISIAVTGYAGKSPDGGEPGLVYIAASSPESSRCVRHIFEPDDRNSIRDSAVEEAIRLAISVLQPDVP